MVSAMRITAQSEEKWTRRAAEWNPGLVISTRTQRKPGRTDQGVARRLGRVCERRGNRNRSKQRSEKQCAQQGLMNDELTIAQDHDDNDTQQQQNHQRRLVFELQYYRPRRLTATSSPLIGRRGKRLILQPLSDEGHFAQASVETKRTSPFDWTFYGGSSPFFSTRYDRHNWLCVSLPLRRNLRLN